jgi:hypothetical protein
VGNASAQTGTGTKSLSIRQSQALWPARGAIATNPGFTSSPITPSGLIKKLYAPHIVKPSEKMSEVIGQENTSHVWANSLRFSS